MSAATPSAQQGDSLAEFRGVAFRYPSGSDDLFTDVSLDLRAGELVLLAGANGSGKSTLVQLLCGSLTPDRGTVRVFGRDPARVDRLPQVGLVTEPFHPVQSPLPVGLTGRELVDWLRVLDGVPEDDERRLRESLQIPPCLMQQPIRQLSKGERQRMLLFGVLLRRPRLILADEPLEGLDPLSRQLIAVTLSERVHTHRVGLLWVSHHLSETLGFADRYMELTGGLLVEHERRRFRITIHRNGESVESVSSFGLEVLPMLVETALAHHGHVRVDVQAAGEPP